MISPSSLSRFILYTTKPRTLLPLFSDCSPDFPCGIIGRYGLPGDYDLEWLRTCANCRPILYLGDADPCDLLIFAWLRSRLEISFRGINDSLLNKCGVTLNNNFTIRQADSESAAMDLVAEQLPDLVNLIGDKCAAIINSE